MNRQGFLSAEGLRGSTWASLERSVARLMQHDGFSDVRLIGQSGDGGADILAHKNSKRYLVQVKYRKAPPIGRPVVDETNRAVKVYRADIPVIATNSLFSREVQQAQVTLAAVNKINLQLWDGEELQRRWQRIPEAVQGRNVARDYQEGAIQDLCTSLTDHSSNRSLVVMATGLGKTFVAAETIRRTREGGKGARKILVLAHTNPIVYQLEKAFHPFLTKYDRTTIWNGNEKPDLEADLTFANINSVHPYFETNGRLQVDYDLVVVDECHHAGMRMYTDLINGMGCGTAGGPYLIGLTATPFRSDGKDPRDMFGDPIVNIDLVRGLREGYLSNVEYRMHMDNIKWDQIGQQNESISPRALNKKIFMTQWDDAVINVIRDSWGQVNNPRAIVFCETVSHALQIRDSINALKFANAAAIYSGGKGAPRISHIERNRILSDFYDGQIAILCAVGILNEGVDVPDVNIVVFQRQTHSRIIFVQQLGRGLRLAEGKDRVLVLDFVSDVRRIAAGMDLQDNLSHGTEKHIRIDHEVKFVTQVGENADAESFLREWLGDVQEVQDRGLDASILLHPPSLRSR